MRVLADYAYFRRRPLLLITALAALLAAVVGSSVFDRVKPFGFQDPDSESALAYDRLEDATRERPLPDVVLLIEPGAPDGAGPTLAAKRAARRLHSVPDVTRVVTPAEDPDLIGTDGRTALVLGFLDADTGDISEVGQAVQDRFADQARVIPGGAAVTARELNTTTEDDLRRIELFAVPLLLVLSLLLFRGLVAAMLPLVVGLLSIVTTLFLLRLLTEVVDIDVFAINIVTGLGLGLAIDYSLFLVSRFREELKRESSTRGALAATMATTGRMIAFSGVTVAVALVSLCIFPQRFLYSIGLGGALVALTSAAVCLLILPALLAFLGDKVNALAPPKLQGRPSSRAWRRVGDFVLGHPASVTIVVVAAMVVAGLPFLRVELTRADASVLPQDASARVVDEEIKARFPSDPASRIVIAVESPNGAAQTKTAVRSLRRNLAIAEVEPPAKVADNLLRVDAQLNTGTFSDPSLDAVEAARRLDWGGEALVGGPSAELIDQKDSLAAHVPIAAAFIVITTILILFAMTRSVVIPFVALIMNTLTVSVAFGVLVLVFQDGRLQGALDYTTQMALDTSMPILLFAVAFGLSTDYGVFLLQRIGEARRETGNDQEAIAIGLSRSSRQITAAALLFAVAMGAFAFSNLVYVKEVAIGTAVAVLVDATVVRAFLFPAVLSLLGPWAWWAPRRLARLCESLS